MELTVAAEIECRNAAGQPDGVEGEIGDEGIVYALLPLMRELKTVSLALSELISGQKQIDVGY